MALLFEDAAKAKDAIMVSQQKEIQALYDDWADDIWARAQFYSHKTNASAAVSERYYKELYKQMNEQCKLIGEEIKGLITSNMYTIADSVVASNVNWLKEFGFSESGLNAAFSHIPNDVVQRLITGQIYQGGWNLSQRIWSDSQQTQRDIYQVMARGLAEQKSVYEIAKDLESYVRPSAKLPWNPVLAMRNTKTGEIEYKRIYKRQVDYSAQRLARTLAQHSYQQSFIATTEENPFVTSYRWHSNGSRVCELCLARDMKVFKKGELPMDHPNGMCTMEPIIVDDMVDQLADWFNSPDGTYPEIDAFAGNFGYEVKSTGLDKSAFINKFGNVNKNNAIQVFKSKLSESEYKEWFSLQKQEKAALGYGPGSGKDFWADYVSGKVKSDKLDAFFAKNLGSTSQPTVQDFIAKYGTSTKSPNAWFNGLTPIQKAEAKLLKEQSGLTWNDWYKQNIYTGDGSNLVTKKAAKQTVQVFNAAQDKYLKPYGFSPTNMPTKFEDWSYKLSYDQGAEILKIMGTSWSDPHPYQKLKQFYDMNLTSSSLASKTTTKKVVSKVDEAVAAFKNKYSEQDFQVIISNAYGGHKESKGIVEEFLKLNGVDSSDFKKFQDAFGDYDPDKYSALVKSFYSKTTGTVATKVDEAVPSYLSKFTKDTAPPSYKDFFAKLSPEEASDYMSAFHASVGADFASLPYEEKFEIAQEFYEKTVLKKLAQGTAKTTTTAATKVDDAFDAAQWYSSLRKNDLSEMELWTRDWLKTIDSTERAGVVTYTGSAYTNMNRYLRGQSSYTDYADEIKAAKAALSKASLPRETIVRRGSGHNMLDDLGIGSVTKENLSNFIGAVVEDKGFVSTSPAPGGGFSGAIEYVIKVPQGSQAMYVDTISRHMGEQELLINCGGKFVVEDIELDSWGGVKKIYMTLINLQ